MWRPTIYQPVNFLALTLILSVGVYVITYGHHYRWTFFCSSWFVLALLPEANVVPLAQLRADRFLYLALPAFALWVALGWERLVQAAGQTRWQIAVRLLAPLAVGVLAITCYHSAAVWHDDVSAWSRLVQRHPWSAVAHQMLGRAYWGIGDAVDAERELQLALRISDQLCRPWRAGIGPILPAAGSRARARRSARAGTATCGDRTQW